jgi:hypothetical protein
MYLSSDEARSDVILAGVATIFGGILVSIVLGAPGVPQDGIAGGIVTLLAWFALSGLTPLLLARYRDDVPAAFGVRPGAGAAGTGLALALAAPVAVVGVTRVLLADAGPVVALLGRPGLALLGSPATGPGAGPLAGALEAVIALVLTAGAFLLVGFLHVRGRDAFRADDRPSAQLLRTIGAGALGTALVLGGVRALTTTASLATLLLNVVGLAVLLFVADRSIPAGAVASRPAVLTPVVVVAVAHVFAAGGVFRGDLLLGLSTGAFAAGTAVVVAVVAEHRRTTVVLLPLLFATHWWPTCLSPLPFQPC